MNRPPGLSTRRASASAAARSVTFLSPKAMVQASAAAAGKGSASALPATKRMPDTSPRSRIRSIPALSISMPGSQTVTSASARRRMACATSPVPPATSIIDQPARGASQSIIAAFQSRWSPPLIRSFIRS